MLIGKKYILATLIAILFTISSLIDLRSCNAQSTYTFSDYVVTNSYDTIYGVVDNKDMWGNARSAIRIEYTDEEGKAKKRTFSPSECRFFYVDVLYESIELNEPVNTYSGVEYPKVFVKKMIDGELSLYLQQYTAYQSTRLNVVNFNGVPATGISPSDVSVYYFKREKEYGLQRASVSKARLIKYFKNCESLVAKLKSREFSKKTIQEIVEFYNSNCK